MIASDHAPHARTDKEVEFDYAASGLTGLETSLALSLRLVADGILTLSGPDRKDDHPAGRGSSASRREPSPTAPTPMSPSSTPRREWTVDRRLFRSRGKNTPFHGWTLKGKAVLTIVGGVIRYRDCHEQTMNARTQHRTEAIVLRLLDYGESDRIVTFCTAGFGKVRGIAKGARRSRKRFANALEPFCCLADPLFPQGTGQPGPDRSVRGDLAFSRDPRRSGKDAGRLLPDRPDGSVHAGRQEERGDFQLLHDFLRLLEARPAAESLLRFFEIRLLKLSGYDPVLDRCLVCKNPSDTETPTGSTPQTAV